MRQVIGVAILATLLGAASAGTSIHRCVGSAGEVVFSQVACGATAVPVELREAQAVGEGLRPSERAWLDQRAREAGPVPGAVSPRSGRPAAADDRQRRYRCERTRQQLDAVRAQRRRGYKAGRGVRLRERQAKYETYLDSFCS